MSQCVFYNNQFLFACFVFILFHFSLLDALACFGEKHWQYLFCMPFILCFLMFCKQCACYNFFFAENELFFYSRCCYCLIFMLIGCHWQNVQRSFFWVDRISYSYFDFCYQFNRMGFCSPCIIWAGEFSTFYFWFDNVFVGLFKRLTWKMFDSPTNIDNNRAVLLFKFAIWNTAQLFFDSQEWIRAIIETLSLTFISICIFALFQFCCCCSCFVLWINRQNKMKLKFLTFSCFSNFCAFCLFISYLFI